MNLGTCLSVQEGAGSWQANSCVYTHLCHIRRVQRVGSCEAKNVCKLSHGLGLSAATDLGRCGWIVFIPSTWRRPSGATLVRTGVTEHSKLGLKPERTPPHTPGMIRGKSMQE